VKGLSSIDILLNSYFGPALSQEALKQTCKLGEAKSYLTFVLLSK
jgi:hypothetical protein